MDPGLYYYRPVPSSERVVTADFCVYGGGSGAVVAAVEAAKRGFNVAIVSPEAHLGGMTAGGLSFTDVGLSEAIGGLAREFYRQAGQAYGVREEWHFEPHVAEKIFDDWSQQPHIEVFRREYLQDVQMQDGAIGALRTVSGLTVRARMFIDASYEGDLLAKAGGEVLRGA